MYQWKIYFLTLFFFFSNYDIRSPMLAGSSICYNMIFLHIIIFGVNILSISRWSLSLPPLCRPEVHTQQPLYRPGTSDALINARSVCWTLENAKTAVFSGHTKTEPVSYPPLGHWGRADGADQPPPLLSTTQVLCWSSMIQRRLPASFVAPLFSWRLECGVARDLTAASA